MAFFPWKSVINSNLLLLKFLGLWPKENNYGHCVEFQPKNPNHVNLSRTILHIWKLMFYAMVGSVVATVLALEVMPVLSGTLAQYELPFWAWYPYKTRTSPLFEIIYLYQDLCVFCIGIVSVNIDLLIMALMMYAGIQCDLLCYDLKKLNNAKNDFNNNLIMCIKHHKKIDSFAKHSNVFFNEILLIQFLTSTASLGLALFQFSLVDPLSPEGYMIFLYVLCIITEIFLYCWFGNEVEIKNDD
ncbi:odorant receptor 4-like [Tribolium madens]|uniref:odorant receptor 4-like n=1 Tax=Tribolium madens TaxID=41895 RepID=UPI001CF74468|nr:odorant receptor 4-like [Tribolium madens]